MPRITMLPPILLAVGLAACLAACEDRPPADGERDTASSSDTALPPDTAPPPDTASPSDTASSPDAVPTLAVRARPAASADTGGTPPPARAELRGYDTVFVYFDGPMPDGATAGPLVPRPRAVPDTGALAFALGELLAGPTAVDTAAVGTLLYSWFSAETAGMLRRAGLEDGVAIVEFDDFRSIIPGASSSAGSAALLRQLNATVFQFPEVRRVEFRIDGSCEAFMAWLQIGCVPIPRAGFSAPPGYREAVSGDRDAG